MENTKNTILLKDKRQCLKCGKKEAVSYKGSPTEFKCKNCGTILVYTPQ